MDCATAAFTPVGAVSAIAARLIRVADAVARRVWDLAGRHVAMGIAASKISFDVPREGPARGLNPILAPFIVFVLLSAGWPVAAVPNRYGLYVWLLHNFGAAFSIEGSVSAEVRRLSELA